MSTIYHTNEERKDPHRDDSLESMNPREQLLGMVVVILVLLLAILFRSM